MYHMWIGAERHFFMRERGQTADRQQTAERIKRKKERGGEKE
jgi:hypothetical protein